MVESSPAGRHQASRCHAADRFDHIGFANAVLAACTRRGTGPA
jgi:hypothetical protein